MEIIDMTALQIGQSIADKQISCVEVLDAVMKQTAAMENEINAYASLDESKSRAAAEAIQKRINAGERLSPLAGVPIGIKDNICTKGTQTACGSKMLEDFKPVYNATSVDRLEQSGMVITGKMNMDEFAMGGSTETSYFGVTRNPHNTDCVPGGSSGGSAAAVAASEAICTLGSDTGGSIRQPCSFCGVSGIKPTYGSVSRFGLVAFASSLDQIGPIGRDVRDCAAILQAISGYDAKDSTSVQMDAFDFTSSYNNDAKGKRIAVPRMESGVDAAVKASVLKAAQTYAGLGAVVEEIELPMVEYAVPAYYIIACAEASSNLSRYDGIKYGYRTSNAEGLKEVYINSRSEGFGIEVKRRIMLGSFVLSSGYYDAYYNKALKVRYLIQQTYNQLFDKYDAILSPVAPTAAYKIGENIGDPLKMYLGDVYTVSVNLAGLPAVSIPCGFDENNMPIGMQLIGKAFSEPRLVGLADTFQQNTDYHTRRCV